MRKAILFLILSALFVFDLSAQQRTAKKQRSSSTTEQNIKIPADRQTSSNARSSRYLIYDKEGHVSHGKYYDLYHEKNYIYKDYKYEVEITYLNTYAPGDVEVSIYADQRHVRTATPINYGYKTYYEYGDLYNHDRYIYISIYGYKSSRFRIKIWKVKKDYGGGGHYCSYNNPLYDLHWLKDIHQKYPDYKICEYEIHGKKYFQVYKCGISHYTEYWYDCNGYKVCEFQNGYTCHEVKNAKFMKCWYTPHHCGTPPPTHCDYKAWYYDCGQKTISAGGHYYVRMEAQNYHKIKWMELYVNGQSVRKESNYPYEWGKSPSDHQLYNLKPGTYKLKCVIYDECGDYREEYCDFTVGGGGGYCNKEVWYEKGKHGTHYRKYSDVYVKVSARKHHDIEWCELYVNGKRVRKEMNAPYEWGKPHSSSDHLLNNMKPGTYKLKCRYKTKCGDYYDEYATIYVDH